MIWILDLCKNYKKLIDLDNEKSYDYQIVVNLVSNLPNNGHTLFFGLGFHQLNWD